MEKIIKFLFFLLFLFKFIIFPPSLLASYEYDITFPVTNGEVYDMLLDNNYLYLGGDFTYIGPFTGSGVVVNATDSAIVTNIEKIDQSIDVAVSDGNGGWYIGGTFNKIGTKTWKRLAHILSDGSLDTNWNPWNNNTGGVTFYTMIKSGNYIYVGGNFTSTSPLGKNYVARINISDGSVDNNWNPNPNNYVRSIVVEGDYIYLAGNFTAISGQSTIKYLAKVNNTTGTIDSSWDPAVNGVVNSIYYDGNYLYVGGNFTSIGGQVINRLARLNIANATADSSWKPNPNYAVNWIVSNGTNIYVGGLFTNINSQSINYLAKLNNNGNADSSFKPNPNSSSNLSFKLINSYLYVVGSFTSIGGVSRNYAAKLNANNGNVDSSWNPIASNTVRIIETDGVNIFLGGEMVSVGGTITGRLARINILSNNLDTNWLPMVNNIVRTIIKHGDYLYLGGNFNSINGTSINRLARVNINSGLLDTDWNLNPNFPIYKLIIDNNFLYIGGSYTVINNQSITYLSRYNLETNTLDTSWIPNPNSVVKALDKDESYVYIGGDFSSVAGQNIPYLARVRKTDGSVDINWVPIAEYNESKYYEIKTISLHNNMVYVGGEFEGIGGKNYKGLARVSKIDGSADNWFSQYQNEYFDYPIIQSFAFSDSFVYVGGTFSIYDQDWNLLYDSFIRVNFLGEIDNNFNWSLYSETGGYWWLNKIILNENNIYLAGIFARLGGVSTNNLAKLIHQQEPTSTPTLTPLSSLTPSPTLNLSLTPTFTPTPKLKKISSGSIIKTLDSSTISQCDNSSKPSGKPDLFQIDVNNTQAFLYFTPAGRPLNKYAVIYGFEMNDERFGIEFSAEESDGVLSYTINHLSPNTTYYFKIRGGNNCASGEWSNIMKITTTKNSSIKKVFYKNLITMLLYKFIPLEKPKIFKLDKSNKPLNSKNFSSNCEYIVKPGDSLWKISSIYYNSGIYYGKIIDKNNLSSNLIRPGQKLKIDCKK